MVKRSTQKFSTGFNIAFLCLSLAFLSPGNKAWGQNANSIEIASYIRQLQNSDQRNLALAALRKAGPSAVDALINVVENQNQKLQNRLLAIYALGEMGLEYQYTVPVLAETLHDRDARVRLSATNALGRMGAKAQISIPALIETLKDSDASVRSGSAYTLSVIGPEAKVAVPALVEALQDPNEGVRLSAASALGRFDSEAKVAVPALVEALQDPNEGVRLSAANALGGLGTEAKTAVPALISAFKNCDKNVCSFTASALGRIGTAASAAIPTLTKALKHHDRDVRLNSAAALGRMGSEARTAIPALVEALQDPDRGVQLSTASALGRIAGNLQDEAKRLSRRDLKQTITALKSALTILESPKANVNDEVIAAVRRSLNTLEAEKESRFSERVMMLVQKYPALSGAITYVISLLALWLALLWLRPLWLLRFNEVLKLTDLNLPLPAGNITVSVRLLLLVNFFNYHPRVLDAWVAAHCEAVQEGFQKKTTVSDRQVYVPIPIVLDGNTITELTGKDLHTTFTKNRGCLLVWGEGGAGKTSLACQLAKWAMASERKYRSLELRRDSLCNHPMLPVLLEQELNFEVTQGKKPLTEAIRGQLQALIGEANPIPDELLDRLLRQRRILVIVDHFSEMSEATRKEIRPGHPDFPANALIVTSRTEETLDGVPKTTLRPLRIEGDRIASFMEAYLTQRGKRQIFSDSEYFDLCRRLSVMVGAA